MSIDVFWEDEAKTILRANFVGEWTRKMHRSNCAKFNYKTTEPQRTQRKA